MPEYHCTRTSSHTIAQLALMYDDTVLKSEEDGEYFINECLLLLRDAGVPLHQDVLPHYRTVGVDVR